ncbi:MAG: S8 family serine peptidase [Propionibacteriaceae bacterium]|nr:S8 family serine peptidase [Propionibacteriaceae bacterium]
MMQKKLWRSAVGLGAALMLIVPGNVASADPPDNSLGKGSDYVSAPDLTTRFATTGKWFVELKNNPTADGGSSRTIQVQQDKFISDARAEGLPAQVSRTYSSLFNGFSVDASATTAATYAKLPGVKAVYPVVPVAAPEPQAVSPELFSAIGMTGADTVQNQLGFTGQGVKVGIIDTGIDIDHPDLGGNGIEGATPFPSARIAYGHDFVGDDYNADPSDPNYNPVPTPDDRPDDCQGHGTHVAGIVGAAGAVTGVAPEVTFGAYRVFGCEGSVNDDILLSALERAEADGMDVVNWSLGSSFDSSPFTPLARAADRLVNNGVVMVMSAGNSGDYFTQATGNAGSKVISVASYDNVKVRVNEMLVRDGADVISLGYSDSTGAPKATSDLDGTPIARTTDPLGCAVETADFSGKVAITSRGTCTFAQKAVNAQNSGAEALIIHNNAPGALNATVSGDTEITIPVLGVTKADGMLIIAALTDDADVPTVEITGDKTTQDNPTGGLISSFSSWGLAADLTLKPDLGAPGGSIYSTYPLENDGYATLSGTSMSSPHVAGAVALMLQANPTLTPAKVLSRLQNTAEPSQFSYIPDAGILDAAHHQGAGLIKVDKAILTTSDVTPGKISTGESADGPYTQTLTITNSGNAAETWALEVEEAVSTHVDPADVEATQNDVLFTADLAIVQFSATSVTVPAGSSRAVDVTILPNGEAIAGTQYSGFIHLTPAGGAARTSVPFAGMAGDYGSLPIFPDLDSGLPALVVLTECNVWFDQQCVDEDWDYEDADAGTVYELGTDLPTVVAHIAYPVARLSVDVLEVDAAGTAIEASKRTAYALNDVGRDGGVSVWSWDGRLADESGLVKEVAPGNYVLRLTGLAADGDGGTQSWTSPAFGIKNAPVPPTPTPTVTVTVTAPPAVVDVYTTPGYHDVNGRKWFTACEKYSQTTRCRTNIFATQVSEVNGKFVSKNTWVFNNLTYLPSPRELWKTNPLGYTGSWTSTEGRQWRTECDTPVSGGNGCRSYIRSRVIEAVPQGKGYTYRWTTKEVFNNIVRFS